MTARTLLAASVFSATLAAQVQAGWVFTVTKADTASTLVDQFDLFARNDGTPTAINAGGTGTQIKGVTFTFTGAKPTSKALFAISDQDFPGNPDQNNPTPDGIVDTVDLFNTNNVPEKSSVRVNVSASSNTFQGVTPTSGFAQPSPWVGGVNAFTLAVANLGTTQASIGTGFRFARLFVTEDTAFTLTGRIGGNIGASDPFALVVTAIPEPTALAAAAGLVLAGFRRRR